MVDSVQYSNKIIIGDRVYLINPTVKRYQIPIDELGLLTMREVPPHSHLEILGVAAPAGAYEAEFFVLNSGDLGETEHLSIYGGVGFEVEEKDTRIGLRRLRQAFPYRDEYIGTRNPEISSFYEKGKMRTFAFLNLNFDKKPDTYVHTAIVPFLEGFERLARPYAHAFICHASEDKPIVRELALALKILGTEVWFDEWEIRVGDSIIQKIDDALGHVTHLVVCLSQKSVNKPWVKKELSAALMRQLAKASIRVLPVLLDDCEIPTILVDIKYASISKGIPRLVDELREGLFAGVEIDPV
jgi:TIR domain